MSPTAKDKFQVLNVVGEVRDQEAVDQIKEAVRVEVAQPCVVTLNLSELEIT